LTVRLTEALYVKLTQTSVMAVKSFCNLRRRGNRVYIYIPSKLVSDDDFPFKFKKGRLKVRIKSKTLILYK